MWGVYKKAGITNGSQHLIQVGDLQKSQIDAMSVAKSKIELLGENDLLILEHVARVTVVRSSAVSMLD